FVVASAPERARLMHLARNVNDAKPAFVIEEVERAIAAKPESRVACMGLTYKADVDDFRESPALEIATALSQRHGDKVFCIDPYENALPADKVASLGLQFMDLDQAMRECDILVMLVPHQAFRSIPRPEAATVVDPVGFWR